MKPLFVLIAFSISFSSFQFLNALYGPSGYQAQEHKKQEILALEENISQLSQIGRSLNNDLSRLNTDSERLRQEAYRLGMLSPEDTLVRMEQINVMNFSYSPGKLLLRSSASLPAPELLVGISLSLGVITLLLLSFFSYEFSLIQKKKKNHTDQGIRIHIASRE